MEEEVVELGQFWAEEEEEVLLVLVVVLVVLGLEKGTASETAAEPAG